MNCLKEQMVTLKGLGTADSLSLLCCTWIHDLRLKRLQTHIEPWLGPFAVAKHSRSDILLH